MRYPLPVDIKTRTGAPDKDERIKNAYPENGKVRKRTGVSAAFITNTGQAQGMAFMSPNGPLLSVNGDKVTFTTTTPGNPSATIPNYSGTWLSGAYSWWTVFTFVKPPTPIPLITAADVTALVSNGTFPANLSNRPTVTSPGVGDFTTVATAQLNNFDNLGAPDLVGYESEQAVKWTTTVSAYQSANTLINGASPVTKAPTTVATGVGRSTFESGSWYTANGYNSSGFKSSTTPVGAPYPDGTNTVTNNGLSAHNVTIDYTLTGGKQINRTVAHQASATLVSIPGTVQAYGPVAQAGYITGNYADLGTFTGDYAIDFPTAVANYYSNVFSIAPGTASAIANSLWAGVGPLTGNKTGSPGSVVYYHFVNPNTGATMDVGIYTTYSTVQQAGQGYNISDTETDSISLSSSPVNLTYQFYAVQTIQNWLILSPTSGYTLTNNTVAL